jgi:type I restriction enzyme S subunit
MFTRVARKGFGDEQLLSVYRDHGVVPKASRDDNFNRASDDLDSYQLVEPGDLAVNKMKAWQGSLSVSSVRGIVSPAYFIYKAHHNHDSRFIHHLLRSAPLIAVYRAISSGVRIAQWDLDPWAFSRLKLPMPPLSEQVAIADYLDSETAQIDTLIAKQEQLIARLREYRQAIILHGASRGLAGWATKPSSLGWTRHIPAHWEELNLRRVATMKTGHTPSRSHAEYWENTTIPWFTLADVWQLRDGTRMYLGETASNISELGLANSAAELLPAGTVVLSRTASVGFSGVMPGPMATSQDFWNWICSDRLLPEYLVYVFRAMRDHLRSLMIGSTHQTIYQPVAASLRIPLPPLDEQRRIVAYLDEQTAKIDTLIEKAERFIELAKERRAALIAAAITGQLDVTAA